MLSSPLGAMQPPRCPPQWGCAREAADTRPRNTGSGSFGRATKFDFSSIAMDKDYFTHKAGPARGSSPTASLAADLSQNFYIDQRLVLVTQQL